MGRYNQKQVIQEMCICIHSMYMYMQPGNWSKDGGLVTEETVTTMFLRVTRICSLCWFVKNMCKTNECQLHVGLVCLIGRVM